MPPRFFAAALLVLLVSPVGAAQVDGDEITYEPLQGFGIRPNDAGRPPDVIRFELIPEEGVVISDLGAVEISAAPNPLGEFPSLDVEPEAQITLSPDLFLMMAERVEGAATYHEPQNRWGFSIQDGTFRFSLDQGLPLLTLGLAAGAIALLAGTIVAAYFLLRERRRKAAALLARRRQAEAREAERSRLAREIHDGPLQDLHALRATIATGVLANGHAATGAPTLDEGIGGVAHELRAIAEGLRPPALGRFGLAAALGAHTTRFRERHPHVDLHLTLDDDGGPGGSRFSESARATLFRIAQEAMSNAVQHGNAQTLEVRLALVPSASAPRSVVLEVRDDGTGIGDPPDLDALVGEGHFGLVGMYERAALLDGSLTIGGAPSLTGTSGRAGTTVRLSAPWDAVADGVPA